MSRVGKKIINIPNGVTVSKNNNEITVKGPKGELKFLVNENLTVEIANNTIEVKRSSDEKFIRAIHGTTRAILNNMVVGVSEGYTKTLELVGIGYRFEQKGNNLLVFVGYSHPIYFIPPAEVKVTVENPNTVKVTGIDKQLVGLVAAKIRSFRKPEPYKGKGIKYSDEVILRKAGKSGKK
ncbi:MAG TPA: 50S ribosomal protein L6 [Ignavibacteriales bacterium]|nr:50S ribosomal protein L6 [Ignavibacteriales bacterium]HOL80165.1 50S ribosomal protein L6 [Ignavibacteriales bacterium]HOM64447.1 50S ribosomal protein L6 [Ignavibacteriales bacterium]HPD67934.1 50S ribosomal protein L6 [Ignavibacteriales bacterium]HPP32354.1 50S ribosomal protein L6 [Ignavibacteriales bacterium]